MGYHKRGANINGIILDRVTVSTVKSCSPVLLNSFLFNKANKIKYLLVSQSFCNVTHIDFGSFYQCLKYTESDYEFVKQYEDSEKAFEEEWAYEECQECLEMHSVFNCPKLLYIPYRSLVYLKQAYQKTSPGLRTPLSQDSNQDYRRKYLKYVRENRGRKPLKSSLDYWNKLFIPLQKVLSINARKLSNSTISSKGTNKRKKVKQEVRIDNQRQNCTDIQFNVDVPFDYENYFSRFNPEKMIDLKLTQVRFKQ